MQFFMKMDRFLEAYGKDHMLSGILEIRHKDVLVYNRQMGMANYEKQIPFSDKSVFSFYSISKPFCALGLMKLWDRGLVELDAHPGIYLPEAKALHPEVTIRHLLQHTSGIPDFEQTKAFAEKYTEGTKDKLREHLAIISTYPQKFAPGTGNFYANINYCILSLLIETLTGQDYGAYMEAEVFAPLGMTDTCIDLPGMTVSNRVQGYHGGNKTLAPVEKSYHWMRGAGDVIGTAKDLYQLHVAIQYKKLVSEVAWEQILTPSPINRFGFGCSLFPWHNRTRIQHNGGHTGFRTLHFQVPEDDFDLILLSNLSGVDIRNDIMEAAGNFFYETTDTAPTDMDKGYI